MNDVPLKDSPTPQIYINLELEKREETASQQRNKQKKIDFERKQQIAKKNNSFNSVISMVNICKSLTLKTEFIREIIQALTFT